MYMLVCIFFPVIFCISPFSLIPGVNFLMRCQKPAKISISGSLDLPWIFASLYRLFQGSRIVLVTGQDTGEKMNDVPGDADQMGERVPDFFGGMAKDK